MLVIHVGPHKTATTYIQHYLYRNARRLKRQGWTYPEIEGAVIRDAHHDLAHQADVFLGQGTPQNDMLRGWADLGPNLLLSAEGFRMWDADRFDRLADALGATDYVLVYALREPISALWSYWAEEVKQGQTIPLAEKFGRFACNPMTSILMNACIDFERYRGSPRAGLSVMPFDLLVADEVDIAAHMVEVVLGVSTEGFAVPRRANERIPIELTEFLRMISIVRSGGARAGRVGVPAGIHAAHLARGPPPHHRGHAGPCASGAPARGVLAPPRLSRSVTGAHPRAGEGRVDLRCRRSRDIRRTQAALAQLQRVARIADPRGEGRARPGDRADRASCEDLDAARPRRRGPGLAAAFPVARSGP